ncbi:MAG TPA: D-2-hydroxyacid dehydrogenase [Candidatus Methylomirabilis sp.]|nr:D-2-hydroxyacid dehydrogenase [Candidatus Methylomirabilis sp.]
MHTQRIVFLDRGSIQANLRRPDFPHEWQDYDNTPPTEVVARLRDATIAASNKVPVRREALAQLPQLKLIAVCATGTNNIDLEYCREKNIPVCNIRHYAMYTVPEHVFALLLALRRNIIAYHRDVRAGAWRKAEQFCLMNHPIRDLHGTTLGIVGHGELGAAVAGIARAFGMRVLIAERRGCLQPKPGRTPFETVLRESDVITLHTPLTPETKNLIGAAELARMKPQALLINTARGGLVDEQALAEALQAGRIGGAASDVLIEEPPRHGNPLLDLDLPNLIVTPHNAWASREAMQIMADQLIDNIESFVRGKLKNQVL